MGLRFGKNGVGLWLKKYKRRDCSRKMDDYPPKLGTSVRRTEYYVRRTFAGINGFARSETGGIPACS